MWSLGFTIRKSLVTLVRPASVVQKGKKSECSGWRRRGGGEVETGKVNSLCNKLQREGQEQGGIQVPDKDLIKSFKVEEI